MVSLGIWVEKGGGVFPGELGDGVERGGCLLLRRSLSLRIRAAGALPAPGGNEPFLQRWTCWVSGRKMWRGEMWKAGCAGVECLVVQLQSKRLGKVGLHLLELFGGAVGVWGPLSDSPGAQGLDTKSSILVSELVHPQ